VNEKTNQSSIIPIILFLLWEVLPQGLKLMASVIATTAQLGFPQ
jgi:hypothetical protein